MSRNKLYLIVISICSAGYIWIAYHLSKTDSIVESDKSNLGFCLMRSITGVPCPSCGTTRSVTALAQGQLAEALWWNPLGLIMFISMITFPVWIVYDIIRRKDTFYKFFLNVENFFRNRPVAIVAITLVLINWIWNIFKFL
jgi:hypothetical protein